MGHNWGNLEHNLKADIEHGCYVRFLGNSDLNFRYQIIYYCSFLELDSLLPPIFIV